MLQYPKLLVTEVLKARYYKNSDFLQAQAGSIRTYMEVYIVGKIGSTKRNHVEDDGEKSGF